MPALLVYKYAYVYPFTCLPPLMRNLLRQRSAGDVFL